MKVRDVMTLKVLSIEPTAMFSKLCVPCCKIELSGLPVVDADGALVGVVTEGDFLRRTKRRRNGTGRVGSIF